MFNKNKGRHRHSEINKSSIIRVVTGVWAANILAGMIPQLNYEPKESINGIFMAIVGTVFVASRSGKNEEEKDTDKDKPTLE